MRAVGIFKAVIGSVGFVISLFWMLNGDEGLAWIGLLFSAYSFWDGLGDIVARGDR